jgi:hypothetical protein
MLGHLLQALSDPDNAEAALARIGTQEIRHRVERAAAAQSVPVGTMVAHKVRHLVDHGGEDIWVDAIGAMSGSPQPGVAAIHRLLDRAFPRERPSVISRKKQI